MSTDYDWTIGATLLQNLPPDKLGAAQYRELVSDTLQRCFDYAEMMSPEGLAKLHIETADGDRIEAVEIAGYFGDKAAEPAAVGPAGLA